jgi:Putative MetA-pathway of phenol degradation
MILRRATTITRAAAASLAALTPGIAGAQTEVESSAAPDAVGVVWVGDARLALQPAQGASDQPKPAESQPLTISTNRPSFDDTAGIVPIGHFQLETGFTFTFRNRKGVETQTWNAPEVLFRIPFIENRLELQLGTSGYVWSRSNDRSGFASTEGFSDATAGLRLKVLDQKDWVPRIALQANTTLGAGSDNISNRDVEPTFKFIWSYDLGKGWGLYGNFALAYLSSSGDRFLQGQAGACVTYTINDNWSVYGEYYVFGPNSKGTDAAHYLDAGAAYLITPRIQLDGRIGLGLNQEANNVFTGFGISFLF